MKRAFLSGFAACYLISGIATARDVAAIPAVTKAGVIYSAVMWLPVKALPHDLALRLVPSWVFDFDKGAK